MEEGPLGESAGVATSATVLPNAPSSATGADGQQQKATANGNSASGSGASSAPHVKAPATRSASGKFAKAGTVSNADGQTLSAGQESGTSGTEERKTKESRSRHNRSDQDATGSNADAVEVKKFKKEPKEPSNSDLGLASQAASNSFNSSGYPASSYLQGLANLPHPYASLFAAADPVTAAAFLTASHHHFGYNSPSASGVPTDLSGKETNANGAGHNHVPSYSGALLSSLTQMDVSAVRQLISGYREAAALLTRTADELDSFLLTRK